MMQSVLGSQKATNSPPRSRFYAGLRVTGLFACSKTDIVTAGQLDVWIKVRCGTTGNGMAWGGVQL
jgi:hypothetical protein